MSKTINLHFLEYLEIRLFRIKFCIINLPVFLHFTLFIRCCFSLIGMWWSISQGQEGFPGVLTNFEEEGMMLLVGVIMAGKGDYKREDEPFFFFLSQQRIKIRWTASPHLIIKWSWSWGRVMSCGSSLEGINACEAYSFVLERKLS